MRIDAGKDRIETEVYILLVYDMLSRHFVLITLALPEVYHKDKGRVRSQAHYEVVWLYVPINKPVTVQHL